MNENENRKSQTEEQKEEAARFWQEVKYEEEKHQSDR